MCFLRLAPGLPSVYFSPSFGYYVHSLGSFSFVVVFVFERYCLEF